MLNNKKSKQFKYLNYFIILLITLIYLIKLDYFPIFADEAIYINWADRIFNGFEGPFISLNDGKPPLFIWLVGVFSRIFKNHLFLSARFISVFLFIVFIISFYFILKKYCYYLNPIITILILSFSPYIFFHTRLAILDGVLSVFLFLGIIFWLIPKIKYYYLISGILFGLAYWTKTPAMFLIPFPVISTLFARERKLIVKAIISVVISLCLILIMKVSVFFPHLFARSTDFTFSPNQILSGQVNHIFGNLKNLIIWFVSYNYYPYLILLIVGIYLAFKNKQKFVLKSVLAAIIFIAPFIIFGKVVASRYYLPAIFLLIMPISYSLSCLKNKKLQITFLIITLIYPLIQNYHLLTNYQNFKFPLTDEHQYLKEWSSGIGIKDSFEFFTQQAKNNKIKVLTEGFFGTTPEGLFIYYADLSGNIKNNFTIVGVGSLSSKEAEQELEKNGFDIIYYLGNSHRIDPIQISAYNLSLIKSYPKKDGYSSLQIFQFPYDI